jgi:hypothetical protein
MGSGSKRLAALAAVAAAIAYGCGGEQAAPQLPQAAPARSFDLAGFEPAESARPGAPTPVSFSIRQPSGEPLTEYASGDGPHTGVHVLFVRSDLSSIIHRHPPVGPDGAVEDEVTFTQPGRYRVVVDAYPAGTGALKNFQLFRWLTVEGAADDAAIPPFEAKQKVDGYTVTMHGEPTLKAVEATFLKVTVTDERGRPAEFVPWYGALAHAILFRAETLDYFHTHVCAPGEEGCASQLGSAQVTGTATKPGELDVGVLLPVAGTWRLFIQGKIGDDVISAPFTLTVTD